MFYQNVRGLLTKIPYLRNALLNVNYDIICLNETWLNSNVFDAELGFNNYNLYRNDRILNLGKSRGGGVLIVVNKNIICELLTVPSVVGIEQIFLNLTVNNIKIIIGCVYIPPGASSDIYSNHCDIVESIFFRFPERYFLIVGDFNLSSFDWSVDPNSQNHRSGGIIFNSYINFLNLEQCNIIKNCDGRILDCLMLSKNAELISNCYLVDSLVHTIDKYHLPLDVVIKFKNSSMSDHYESPYILNFKKCNFNEISHFLSSIDFNLNFNKNLSLDPLVDSFYEIIYHTFSLFVPKTKIYSSYSPAWANAELRNLIIKKKCAHKKYKLSTSFANYMEFSELRKKCKKLNQISHDQYKYK